MTPPEAPTPIERGYYPTNTPQDRGTSGFDLWHAVIRDAFDSTEFSLLTTSSRNRSAFGEAIGLVAQDAIWNVTGAYPYPTSALTTTIVSTSANDIAAGTGAREVTVTGIDGNWDAVTETIALNGLTPVTLSTNLLRVNLMDIGECGSSGTNEGDIDILHSPTVLGRIDIGLGRSKSAVLSVPNGVGGYIERVVSGIEGNNSANALVGVYTRSVVSPLHGWIQHHNGTATAQKDYEQSFNANFIPLVPGTDCEMRIVTISGGGVPVTGMLYASYLETT